MSPTCPVVTMTRRGQPRVSASRWIIVVNPPRERPIVRSLAPIPRRQPADGGNYGAVDHQILIVSIRSQRFKDQFSHFGMTPATETAVHCFPFTVAFRQLTPMSPRAQRPLTKRFSVVRTGSVAVPRKRTASLDHCGLFKLISLHRHLPPNKKYGVLWTSEPKVCLTRTLMVLGKPISPRVLRRHRGWGPSSGLQLYRAVRLQERHNHRPHGERRLV